MLITLVPSSFWTYFLAEGSTEEERKESDSRSIYIGNVDWDTTPPELQEHFSACGIVERVTIKVDKRTNKPMGYAYMAFESADNVELALAMDDSVFKGRVIKVSVCTLSLYCTHQALKRSRHPAFFFAAF